MKSSIEQKVKKEDMAKTKPGAIIVLIEWLLKSVPRPAAPPGDPADMQRNPLNPNLWGWAQQHICDARWPRTTGKGRVGEGLSLASWAWAICHMVKGNPESP